MLSNERVGTMKANHVLGGYKATEYLIQRGHHRILHITGEIKENFDSESQRIFRVSRTLWDRNS